MSEPTQLLQKNLTLGAETAIAAAVGAAVGIASFALLPEGYSLPAALLAAIVIPKKNKGISTAFVLLLSWLIAFTLALQ